MHWAKRSSPGFVLEITLEDAQVTQACLRVYELLSESLNAYIAQRVHEDARVAQRAHEVEQNSPGYWVRTGFSSQYDVNYFELVTNCAELLL